MNRDDRIVRNVVIAFAIVEAIAIAYFVASRLGWFDR
jgi:hypothetical protein